MNPDSPGELHSFTYRRTQGAMRRDRVHAVRSALGVALVAACLASSAHAILIDEKGRLNLAKVQNSMTSESELRNAALLGTVGNLASSATGQDANLFPFDSQSLSLSADQNPAPASAMKPAPVPIAVPVTPPPRPIATAVPKSAPLWKPAPVETQPATGSISLAGFDSPSPLSGPESSFTSASVVQAPPLSTTGSVSGTIAPTTTSTQLVTETTEPPTTTIFAPSSTLAPTTSTAFTTTAQHPIASSQSRTALTRGAEAGSSSENVPSLTLTSPKPATLAEASTNTVAPTSSSTHHVTDTPSSPPTTVPSSSSHTTSSMSTGPDLSTTTPTWTPSPSHSPLPVMSVKGDGEKTNVGLENPISVIPQLSMTPLSTPNEEGPMGTEEHSRSDTPPVSPADDTGSHKPLHESASQGSEPRPSSSAAFTELSTSTVLQLTAGTSPKFKAPPLDDQAVNSNSLDAKSLSSSSSVAVGSTSVDETESPDPNDNESITSALSGLSSATVPVDDAEDSDSAGFEIYPSPEGTKSDNGSIASTLSGLSLASVPDGESENPEIYPSPESEVDVKGELGAISSALSGVSFATASGIVGNAEETSASPESDISGREGHASISSALFGVLSGGVDDDNVQPEASSNEESLDNSTTGYGFLDDSMFVDDRSNTVAESSEPELDSALFGIDEEEPIASDETYLEADDELVPSPHEGYVDLEPSTEASAEVSDAMVTTLTVSHPTTFTPDVVAEEIRALSADIAQMSSESWTIESVGPSLLAGKSNRVVSIVRQSTSGSDTNEFDMILDVSCKNAEDCNKVMADYKEFVREGQMDEALMLRDFTDTQVRIAGEVSTNKSGAMGSESSGLSAPSIAGIAVGGVALLSLVILGAAFASRRTGGIRSQFSPEHGRDFDDTVAPTEGGTHVPEETYVPEEFDEYGLEGQGSFMISEFGGTPRRMSMSGTPWMNDMQGLDMRPAIMPVSAQSSFISLDSGVPGDVNNMPIYRFDETTSSDSEKDSGVEHVDLDSSYLGTSDDSGTGASSGNAGASGTDGSSGTESGSGSGGSSGLASTGYGSSLQ